MSHILEITDVHKSYGRHDAIKGVSLSLHAGDRCLLTGPSGSGKSTLLRLIAGFETPESGHIKIHDQIVSASNRVEIHPRDRDIGMLFQDLGLWPHLNATETLGVALSGRKLSRREKHQRITDALAHVGLTGHERKKPGALSGGEQQRLALARALIGEPKLLLLDEPFSSVDLKTRLALCDLVVRESRDKGVTIIMAGHDLSDALRMDAYVVVLEEGVIRQKGSLPEIIVAPQSDTARLWAQVAQVGKTAHSN